MVTGADDVGVVAGADVGFEDAVVSGAVVVEGGVVTEAAVREGAGCGGGVCADANAAPAAGNMRRVAIACCG